MKHLISLVFGGLLLTPLTEAAGFNCKKVERTDEKTICANRALSDKDVEMSVKYHFFRGLFAMGGRDATQDRQQDWLRERWRRGDDTDCLSRVYTQRTDELDK